MKTKLIIGAVLIVLLIIGYSMRSFLNAPSAAGNMEEYVTFRHPAAVNPRVQCQRADTDGNNYVSCEASFELNGKSKNIVAECPVLFSINSKCRAARNTFVN
jgi:hypothetical protein